jgi:molybdenum cofactor cytidylyltransferase
MIPAVILAAGASTRMGRPKALLPIGRDKETFVGRLLRTFSEAGVDDLVVVVGASATAVSEAIARMPVFARVVENRGFERGQLSSLVAALDVVDRPGVQAVMAMPVDMPLVGAATVRAVAAAYRRHRPLVARPVLGGRHGHPVIFDRALFVELRGADFAVGARAVIAAHLCDVLDVPVTDSGSLHDIDTPEEYERHTGLRLNGRDVEPGGDA